METMRYQENKKSGKWPIIFFSMFVVVGGALIVLGIANEDSPQIVGGAREEVQGLVDIYTEDVMANIYEEEEEIDIKDITFDIKDEKVTDSTNQKFTADILLPKLKVMDEEVTDINKEIKDKFTKLYDSLKSEMSTVENSFTFKTTYKYYDNIIGDKRILSITIHQRIVDDNEGTTTTDKVITYNIDLAKCKIVDEADIAIVMFGKEYKTVIKNAIKDYVVNEEIMDEDDFVYALTGLENYYIKDGTFHIIFNESEIVDKKYGVLDIEIEKEDKEDKEDKKTEDAEETSGKE